MKIISRKVAKNAKETMGKIKENVVAKHVLDAAFRIHTRLGPGLFESAYLVILAHDLRKRGLKVETEVLIPVCYEGEMLEHGFRADMIVEDCVIVELKSVEVTAPVHKKQVLTYLRLSNMRLGLLINFGSHLIKHGIFRIANGLPDEN